MYRRATILMCAILYAAIFMVAKTNAEEKWRTLNVKSVNVKANQVVIIVGKPKTPEKTETLQITDDTKIIWLYAKDRKGAITDIGPKDQISVVQEDGKLKMIQLFKKP